MMKDSSGHYAGHDLWGDGGGWLWFDAANPSSLSRSLPSRPLKGGGRARSTECRPNGKPWPPAGASVGLDLRW
jgi:hypothetical protein